MLNQSVIVGRIVKIEKIEHAQNGKKLKIVIGVPRSFKSKTGEYEYDNIPCLLFKGVAESTFEYCEKGDLVGIKGRLQKLDENEEMIVIAEKVTFLSPRKEKKEQEIKGGIVCHE